MSKIEMMEVNQHTSDEVARVLADLEAQGVDIAALQTALTAQGTNIATILQKVQNSGGLQLKSVQRGTIVFEEDDGSGTATISSVNVSKSLVFHLGTGAYYVGSSGAQAGTFSYYMTRVELTNATTVTAKRQRKGNGELTVGFQVVEFA